MIDPVPFWSMCGSTARQHRNWLVRHVRIVQSHASKRRVDEVGRGSRVHGVGVVVQRVHRAEALDRGVDERVHVVFDGQVDAVRQRRAAG